MRALSSHQMGLLPVEAQPSAHTKAQMPVKPSLRVPATPVKSNPFAFHLRTRSFQSLHKGRWKGEGRGGNTFEITVVQLARLSPFLLTNRSAHYHLLQKQTFLDIFIFTSLTLP